MHFFIKRWDQIENKEIKQDTAHRRGEPGHRVNTPLLSFVSVGKKMGLSTIFSCSKPLRSELEIASKHHPMKLVTVGLMRLLQQTRLCLFAMNRHDPSKLYVCSPNRHDPSKLHDCSPNRHDPPKLHDCTEQS